MSAMLSYDAQKFVNRQEEIERVTDAIERIRSGETQAVRTLIFQGERGSGKSWLALHLNRTILPDLPGVTPLLVCLFPRPEGQNPQERELFVEERYLDPDVFTEQITRWIGEQIQATIPDKASLRELTGWLTREVEKQASQTPETQQIIVLIIDSVFEADWQLLKKLEDHLLAPLAALPNVLIVMTGRGRLYSWESPYLRVAADSRILETFRIDQIKEQLRLQAPGKEAFAADIFMLAAGYPGANILLAQRRDQPHGLSHVVDELLKVIGPDKRQSVREYLEALCVLEGFRDEEIPVMIAAYYNNPQYRRRTSTAEVRAIRNRLLETHLVRWEDGRYQIDRPICLLLRNVLLQDKRETWVRLQCQAYWLYRDWAQKFARGRDYFTGRAEDHARALRAESVDPEQCPDTRESVQVAQISGQAKPC